ncbi:MAG: MutH/Sau3AI family endonuclease [Bifidobacterium angulatum]
MDDRHIFTKAEVESILNECHGKTLKEIDSAHVLQVSKKGNKGYPGAIIEQSVFGYPADNKARPDLLIDGVEVELKTTGIYERGKGKDTSIEAKQPVSITGVKPSQIVNEDFESSVFWHKCAHLLFVYYWYAHYATPKDTFYVCGFSNYEPSIC